MEPVPDKIERPHKTMSERSLDRPVTNGLDRPGEILRGIFARHDEFRFYGMVQKALVKSNTLGLTAEGPFGPIPYGC